MGNAYTEAQKRAIKKYAGKTEELRARVPEAEAKRYKAAAAKAGTSFAKFVTTALDEKIERDGLDQ